MITANYEPIERMTIRNWTSTHMILYHLILQYNAPFLVFSIRWILWEVPHRFARRFDNIVVVSWDLQWMKMSGTPGSHQNRDRSTGHIG